MADEELELEEDKVLEEGAKDGDEASKPSEEEAIARKIGWVSLEEWEGEEDNWRPAEDYLKRPDVQIARRVLDTVSKEQEERDAIEAKRREEDEKRFEELRETSARAVQMAGQKAEEEYQERLAEIARREEEAVAAKDIEGFKAIREERENLEPPEPVSDPDDGKIQERIEALKAERPWTQSGALSRIAERLIGEEIERAGPMTLDDQFEYLDVVMERDYGDQVSKYSSASDPGKKGGDMQNGRRRKNFDTDNGGRDFSAVDDGDLNYGGDNGGDNGGDANHGLNKWEIEGAMVLIRDGTFKDLAEYAKYTKNLDKEGLTRGGRSISE